MKHLIVLLIILGVLAVPIPPKQMNNLNKDNLVEALNSIQKFFNIVDHCKVSQWTGVYEQPDGTIMFVIECTDKEA